MRSSNNIVMIAVKGILKVDKAKKDYTKGHERWAEKAMNE